MARVTSEDVAKRAGVSTATVSHVINNTRFVSEETRSKVLEAIRYLGYAPNAVARSMVTNITQTIGVAVSDITNPFFPAVVRGIEDEIVSYRYNMILGNTNEDPEREENLVHLLTTQHVDGLIVAPTGIRCEALLALERSGVPIIQVDRSSPGLDAPLVAVNNEEGACRAVSYLIGLGHRRIACLLGIDTITTQTERLDGWRRALREAGLPADDDLIVRADPRFYGTLPGPAGSASLARPASQLQTMPGADQALWNLLERPDRPSALFVLTNQLALGALYGLKQLGLKCPEDVSLLSFDDLDWAPLFSPPLTTVRQPTYQLGQTGARLLLQMINGQPVESPPALPVDLVIRASCAPPADGRA